MDHNKESSVIKPDSVFAKDDRVIVNEYKYVKLDKEQRKRARTSEEDTLKFKVVNNYINIVTKNPVMNKFRSKLLQWHQNLKRI